MPLFFFFSIYACMDWEKTLPHDFLHMTMQWSTNV